MKKKLNKVLSCFVIGGLLLVSGGTVWAASDSAAASRLEGARDAGMFDNLKEVLGNLVESDGITQEQADQLLQLEEEKQAQRQETRDINRAERKGMMPARANQKDCIFTDAVEEGIITEDEQASIYETFCEYNQKERQAEWQSRLDQLISQGTISQEQADAVMAKIQDYAAVRQAETQKIRDMSDEQRQQYLQNSDQQSNLLDDLISDSVITKAQAYDIAKSIGGGFHKSPRGHLGK